jgi:hypothetical protein
MWKVEDSKTDVITAEELFDNKQSAKRARKNRRSRLRKRCRKNKYLAVMEPTDEDIRGPGFRSGNSVVRQDEFAVEEKSHFDQKWDTLSVHIVSDWAILPKGPMLPNNLSVKDVLEDWHLAGFSPDDLRPEGNQEHYFLKNKLSASAASFIPEGCLHQDVDLEAKLDVNDRPYKVPVSLYAARLGIECDVPFGFFEDDFLEEEDFEPSMFSNFIDSDSEVLELCGLVAGMEIAPDVEMHDALDCAPRCSHDLRF